MYVCMYVGPAYSSSRLFPCAERNPARGLFSAVKQADVVLITSSREASPLVVLECMAAGTPWVSLDVGCVRENSGGVLVSSDNEMVSVTLQLLNDPQRREQLAHEGRRAAIERHRSE